MENFDANSRPTVGVINPVREQGIERYNNPCTDVEILPCQIGYVESYFKTSKKGVEREWFDVWLVIPGKKYVKIKICGAVKDKPDTITSRAWDFWYLVTRQKPDVFKTRKEFTSNFEPFERVAYPDCSHVKVKVVLTDRGEYNGYYIYDAEFLDHDTELSASELKSGAKEPKDKEAIIERMRKRHDETQQQSQGGFNSASRSAPVPAQKAPAAKPAAPDWQDDIPF